MANAGIAINGSIGRLTRAEKEDAYYLMCGGVIDLICLLYTSDAADD